jgi:hypothetical protein
MDFGLQNLYDHVIYPSIGNIVWNMDGWMDGWMDGLKVGEIKSPHPGHKSGQMCTNRQEEDMS